jgi:23S rRNA pseudoU1915 N3-methylase RlmH
MIRLKFITEVGESNGVMRLDITDSHNKNYDIRPLEVGHNTTEITVEAPNKLFLKLTGKNNRRDTVIDKNTGKIIKDKFVKVIGLEIDGKPLGSHRVAQMFTLKNENNDEINSAFWGFNGMVELDIPYTDALDMHLANMA